MELLEETHFDAIVLGTGLPESILASALAQAKKSILHLDERNHYGGLWSSFQLHQMVQFLKNQELKEEDPKVNPFLHITLEYPLVSLSSIFSHLTENPPLGDETAPVTELLEDHPGQLDLGDFSLQHFQEWIFSKLPEKLITGDFRPLMTTAVQSLFENTYIPYKQMEEVDQLYTLNQVLEVALYNLEKLAMDSRHFCIELTIKKLLANGEFTQLIMNSGISNYLEFKLTSQTQVCGEDGLIKVPFSKQDVFVDERLSLMDKRKLMKFLLFARSYHEQPELWEAKRHMSLSSFLAEGFSLNDEAISAIVHCIALSQAPLETINVETGLRAISNFIGSIGRFGSHSLLWALYGAGSEISQAFCRLCALHNGIYILNCPPKTIELPLDGNVGITLENSQVLSATSLITNIDHLPLESRNDIQITEYVSRMVVGVKRIEGADEVQLVIFPEKVFSTPAPIFGLVLSNEGACPPDQSLIYLWSVLPQATKKDYLSLALHSILESQETTIYFQMTYSQAIRTYQASLPLCNVIVCDDPSPDLTLESLIPFAFTHFQNLTGSREFFPHIPENIDLDS
ncbi:hypothetical protein DSO57_1026180 [Entomophthora muscae]|uniref:Uncharacterized protein n=3 Tax=Entomophthora muscae TaxID=34485 RepID=A0ACC2S461_9FUNG|nr:hypothetical protein DSO57_1026180 [Entomophthora muscae]